MMLTTYLATINVFMQFENVQTLIKHFELFDKAL